MKQIGKYLELEEAKKASLNQLLVSIEKSLGIHITIHDPRGLFYGATISSEWFRHRHELCSYKRSGDADKRCIQTCLDETGSHSRQSSISKIKHCWKGLTEVVVPIYADDDFKFIIFAGLFKSKESSSIFQSDMIKTFEKLEICDQKRALNISRVINHIGQSILLYLENFYFASQEDDRMQIIQRYIYHHATQKISLEELASHLFLSKSRTSHLVSSLFGKSFSELIKEERIKRACSILRNSRKPIYQIPPLIGIENEYYFYRLFKKEMGSTPRQYRQQFIEDKKCSSSNNFLHRHT